MGSLGSLEELETAGGAGLGVSVGASGSGWGVGVAAASAALRDCSSGKAKGSTGVGAAGWVQGGCVSGSCF